MIANDGVPQEMKGTSIKQCFNDGTFKTFEKSSIGLIAEHKGTFELLADNTVIIFKPESGNSSTAAITKLTKKEFVTKGEKYTTYRIAY